MLQIRRWSFHLPETSEKSPCTFHELHLQAGLAGMIPWEAGEATLYSRRSFLHVDFTQSCSAKCRVALQSAELLFKMQEKLKIRAQARVEKAATGVEERNLEQAKGIEMRH